MTISSGKKVSVIVPNYNYVKYIDKRIDSIVRQTYPIYELIVLDDASNDGSRELIRKKIAEVTKKYPDIKVRFVENKHNSGKAMAAWKKGFELSTGDYVWIAEADDLCSRTFLEEVMKGFEDPDVVLAYTESRIINSWGLMIAPNFRWSRDRERTGHYKTNYTKNGVQEIEEIMAIRCTIPNVSAVVFEKAKKIPYLQYLEESLKYSQVGDWFFYVKVLEHGKISYNHKSLNYFRVHKDSKTSQAKKDNMHLREIEEMHKRLTAKYNLGELVTRRMKNEEERIRRRMA